MKWVIVDFAKMLRLIVCRFFFSDVYRGFILLHLKIPDMKCFAI
jgi:hypothetical protein